MLPISFWTDGTAKDTRAVIVPALSKLKVTVPYELVPFGFQLPSLTPGGVCLAMGDNPIKILAAAGIVHKNRTASSLRETLFNWPDGEGNETKFLISHHPSAPHLDLATAPEIEWDVQLTARYAMTGSMEAKLGEYRWVEDFSEVIERIKEIHAETNKPVPVAGDIETQGLSPHKAGARIIALGFTADEKKADLIYVPEIKTNEQAKLIHSQVQWLLTSPIVRMRGANFKFDLNWIQVKWGILCTNFSMDTLLVGSLLNENRRNSLKDHVKAYAMELGGYDNEMTKADKQDMASVPKDKMLGYLGGDVDGTLRVSNRMIPELSKEPGLQRFYVKVLHPGARTFARVEREGIVVNVEKYNVLRSDLQAEIARLNKEGLALLPARIRAKFSDDLTLTRPAILKDYFFGPMGLNLKPRMKTEKSGEPSTAKAHFEMFDDVPEAMAMAKLLKERNQADKCLSTFVEGFLKHLNPDGRFRPSYFLHNGGNEWGNHDGGTNTGRLSAIDPAIQTTPKRGKWGKRVRDCMEAPEGHVILECDYAQGELKLTACISGEQVMLQVYHDKKDLHTTTGAKSAGLDYDDMMALKLTDADQFDLLRYKAKAKNFGLIYGMQSGGFQKYAWANYNLRFTDEEAETEVSSFHDTYPGLKDWHKRAKQEASKNLEMVSPLGRIRHLPHIISPDKFTASKAGRQAINAPVQSTLSDMLVWSMSEVERAYPTYAPVASIHDAAYYVVPEDQGADAAHRVTSVMESLDFAGLFGWTPELTFSADAKLGADLAHMKEA